MNPEALATSWTDFLGTFEPLRPSLYRYCRHLTQSAWDAEDLAQDALARAFVTLAQMRQAPPNPRAWLFRVASNLWLDRVRRARLESPSTSTGDAAIDARDPRETREAAGTLLGQLSPQERAAVVLKDVLDLSLEETADALSTTVGTIKSALHRARGKLTEPIPADAKAPPAPAALTAFCDAFNAGDINKLAALLLETSSVEVVGATTQFGPEAAKKTVLQGMLFGVERMAAGDPSTGMEPTLSRGVRPTRPRVELRAHRGAWIVLHWYSHDDGEAVRAITRLEVDDDHVARLRNYFYNPELIAEVCAELGLPSRPNGYRWCAPTSR